MKKLHHHGAAPLLTGLSLAMMLSGCQLWNSSAEQDTAEPVATSGYYSETIETERRVRVIDPDAAGYQRQTAPDRRAEVSRAVRNDRPQTYTVVKGDTLWDISGKFLHKPWLWPEIWDINPQIENPHLIYPGDEVSLRYVDGKPVLVVSRDGTVISGPGDANAMPPHENGVVRLSPQIRESSLSGAIPMIPGDAIQQFLVYPRVVDIEDLTDAPYVIGDFEGRLASASGQQIYVRGDLSDDHSDYGIFRQSKKLQDPDTGELLGYEITHVADATLLEHGDPATVMISSAKMETLAGDRLLPQNQNYVVHNYMPRVPQIEGEGKIISLFNAISQSGRNQVVVLNLGDREGVRVGDVMAIEHRGGRIKDRFSGKSHDYVNIPNTRIGVLMVFRTFDKVSYGLIMESTRPIHKNDVVAGI
ncbi:LysM peptidoglycan-binding domain-containing protein [Granulosicoccaceae sp. 1_MG-2023]|nr:LysM peptidoglycan-binding domain-containing protein [Granulosicoccaceae sp. 1_MG-2023]